MFLPRAAVLRRLLFAGGVHFSVPPTVRQSATATGVIEPLRKTRTVACSARGVDRRCSRAMARHVLSRTIRPHSRWLFMSASERQSWGVRWLDLGRLGLPAQEPENRDGFSGQSSALAPLAAIARN